MPTPASAPCFVPHVLSYTHPAASDADRAKLLEGLQKLRGIPIIQLAHIGPPADTDCTYAYSWLSRFASTAEQSYQQHPVHDEFRRDYAHY